MCRRIELSLPLIVSPDQICMALAGAPAGGGAGAGGGGAPTLYKEAIYAPESNPNCRLIAIAFYAPCVSANSFTRSTSSLPKALLSVHSVLTRISQSEN